MTTVMRYYREGSIKPLPVTIFQVSELKEAIMFSTRIEAIASKAAVNFTDKSSLIKVRTCSDVENRHTLIGLKFRRLPPQFQFDSAATYLLVGCLGGLGQLYSRWMVEMGARSLTFLSRSGSDREDTQCFVSELKSRNVEVQVVKGDVSHLGDVKTAVAATSKPIRGVVQAALTLQVMSSPRLSHRQSQSNFCR